jgi:hypothetical protein
MISLKKLLIQITQNKSKQETQTHLCMWAYGKVNKIKGSVTDSTELITRMSK